MQFHWFSHVARSVHIQEPIVYDGSHAVEIAMTARAIGELRLGLACPQCRTKCPFTLAELAAGEEREIRRVAFGNRGAVGGARSDRPPTGPVRCRTLPPLTQIWGRAASRRDCRDAAQLERHPTPQQARPYEGLLPEAHRALLARHGDDVLVVALPHCQSSPSSSEWRPCRALLEALLPAAIPLEAR
jgi:hypothetical protein